MRVLALILTISLLALTSNLATSAEFNLRPHGATGNGTTRDTAAIQKAIDTCAQAGGGEVLYPKGTYR